jgi:retron-type reverse transcriptase
MCREQKTVDSQQELPFAEESTDCLEGSRVEPENRQGVQSITTNKTTGGDSVDGRKPDKSLLKQMLDVNNIMQAMERVIRNGGAAGVDGMTVQELQPWFMAHCPELYESIEGGWYKPKPVRRVEIPKPDGGIRLLGVPTVIDRMVQQAMVQVLQPIFEQTFSGLQFRFSAEAKCTAGDETSQRIL